MPLTITRAVKIETQPVPLAAGHTPGDYRIDIALKSNPANIIDSKKSATPVVPTGSLVVGETYTITMMRLDTAGAVIGTPIKNEMTVVRLDSDPIVDVPVSGTLVPG